LLPSIVKNEKKSLLERKLAQLKAMQDSTSEFPSNPILKKIEEKSLTKKFNRQTF